MLEWACTLVRAETISSPHGRFRSSDPHPFALRQFFCFGYLAVGPCPARMDRLQLRRNRNLLLCAPVAAGGAPCSFVRRPSTTRRRRHNRLSAGGENGGWALFIGHRARAVTVSLAHLRYVTACTPQIISWRSKVHLIQGRKNNYIFLIRSVPPLSFTPSDMVSLYPLT
jgi:hypothetical protein